MSDATVEIKTENETGKYRVTITIDQRHPLLGQILHYAMQKMAVDPNQLRLPYDKDDSPDVEAEIRAQADADAYRPPPAETDEERAARETRELESAADHMTGRRNASPPPAICKTVNCPNEATKGTGYCRVCNKAIRELRAEEERRKRAEEEEARKRDDGDPPLCVEPGCDNLADTPSGSNMCPDHLAEAEAEAESGDFTFCRVDGCKNGANAHALCNDHHCANPACPNTATPSGLCGACMADGKRPAARAGATE